MEQSLRNVYSQLCLLETGCKDEHGSKGAVEVFGSPPGHVVEEKGSITLGKVSASESAA
jgi:hypothetical protein